MAAICRVHSHPKNKNIGPEQVAALGTLFGPNCAEVDEDGFGETEADVGLPMPRWT
jgi:hypothetical protein